MNKRSFMGSTMDNINSFNISPSTRNECLLNATPSDIIKDSRNTKTDTSCNIATVGIVGVSGVSDIFDIFDIFDIGIRR